MSGGLNSNNGYDGSGDMPRNLGGYGLGYGGILPPTESTKQGQSLSDVSDSLSIIEARTKQQILGSLSNISSNRNRKECDKAFEPLWESILQPYHKFGLGHRAATFALNKLIPEILRIEASSSPELHKGALFYNTAIAHLRIGDHDRFEYFLAMADEEDTRTLRVEGNPNGKKTNSFRASPLSKQTIEELLTFGCDLLNTAALNYQFVFGSDMTSQRLDGWRLDLDEHHHAEFFRIMHEAEVFTGKSLPDYPPAFENQIILLRLVKVLTHLAQWGESRLTKLQNGQSGMTLTEKLRSDGSFRAHSRAPGCIPSFPGRNVHGAGVDSELDQRLIEIMNQTSAIQREWRLLRILFVIRNSTAHTIDPSLRFYKDRQFLLKLIRAVLLACFTIEKVKGNNNQPL